MPSRRRLHTGGAGARPCDSTCYPHARQRRPHMPARPRKPAGTPRGWWRWRRGLDPDRPPRAQASSSSWGGRSMSMLGWRLVAAGPAGPKASRAELTAGAGMVPPWPPKAERVIHVDGPVVATRRMMQVERGKLEEGREVSTMPAPRLVLGLEVWHRPRHLPQTAGHLPQTPALMMAPRIQCSLHPCHC